MGVQAQPATWRRGGSLEGDYSVAPAIRKDSHGDANALGVETEGLMET